MKNRTIAFLCILYMHFVWRKRVKKKNGENKKCSNFFPIYYVLPVCLWCVHLGGKTMHFSANLRQKRKKTHQSQAMWMKKRKKNKTTTKKPLTVNRCWHTTGLSNRQTNTIPMTANKLRKNQFRLLHFDWTITLTDRSLEINYLPNYVLNDAHYIRTFFYQSFLRIIQGLTLRHMVVAKLVEVMHFLILPLNSWKCWTWHLIRKWYHKLIVWH